MSKSRIDREAEFHDKAFTENTRSAAGKFYAITETSKGLYHSLIGQDCTGKQILEYGCGTGSYAFKLAQYGANVAGIDISEAGIDLASKQAETNGVGERTSFQVMDAEKLGFSDDYFDVVCGSGILHHLHLEQAMKELARVLKPDGRAVFFEPLGHNPLINLYRRLTPNMRSEDEHPLSYDDLHSFSQFFAQVELRFFHLCSLMAVPFRKMPGFRALQATLAWLDRLLFKIPFLKKQAWIVVIKVGCPRVLDIEKK